MADYKAVATSQHGYDEEMQWARVAARGDPATGVALVFVQKLCTAFHELEPAWQAGALEPGHLEYFRGRMLGRSRSALAVLETNGLGAINGVAGLKVLMQSIETAATMAELVALEKVMHDLGHTLCEALEKA